MFRGRIRRVTYLYEDPDHPDRPSGHLESPEWTAADRALLVALARYEGTLCPGCGQPKQLAWHGDLTDWWEADRFICGGCTAKAGGVEQVFASARLQIAVEDLPALAPLEIGVNTRAPSDPT